MTRPTCSYCVPQVAPFPSGLSWVHDRGCPLDNGQKIKHVDEPLVMARVREIRPDTPKQDAARKRRHRLETASKGVPTRKRSSTRLRADQLHPACEVAIADGREPCSRCKWISNPEAV